MARVDAKILGPFGQVVAGQHWQLRQVLQRTNAAWVDAGLAEVITIERRTSSGYPDQGTQPSLLISSYLRGVGVLEYSARFSG